MGCRCYERLKAKTEDLFICLAHTRWRGPRGRIPKEREVDRRLERFVSGRGQCASVKLS
jgi:hypothetical protein